MGEVVKRRKYDSRTRREAAAATRRRVLGSAYDLFLARGWGGTTVADIARTAGVSLDTVYASVGRKPELLVAVHDMVLGSAAEPIPATERDYVREVRAAGSGREKLETYAAAVAQLFPRSVPLMNALRDAGLGDPTCRALHTEVTERRARNMRLLAEELRATGDLRPGLADEVVADLIWSLNSPEWFTLITSRGHSPQRYGELLADVLCRTLLRTGAEAP